MPAYTPDKNIIFFDPLSKKPERLIFELDTGYLDFEEAALEELDEHIRKHKNCDELEEYFDIPNKLRFLQSNHYKAEKTIENMTEHIKFLKQHIGVKLSDEAIEILHKGLFYTYGRDRYFRPVCVFRAAVLTENKVDYDEAIKAACFVASYIVRNLMVPGKVENWTLIDNLSNLAIHKLPLKFIIRFLKLAETQLKFRDRAVVLLNVTFAIRMIYKIVSPFLDDRLKAKLTMTKDSTHEILNELIHPSQLQK